MRILKFSEYRHFRLCVLRADNLGLFRFTFPNVAQKKIVEFSRWFFRSLALKPAVHPDGSSFSASASATLLFLAIAACDLTPRKSVFCRSAATNLLPDAAFFADQSNVML